MKVKDKSSIVAPLRALIVEDNKDAAELLVHKLRQGGFDPVTRCVDTAQAMRAALENETWDIVLSDYKMPQFSGTEALKILQDYGLDIPFIVISGTIGEEVAVEMMRAGANDYLFKDKLLRLIEAVKRELREAKIRNEAKLGKEQMARKEKLFRSIIENSSDVIALVDANGITRYLSPSITRTLGYDEYERVGHSAFENIHPVDLPKIKHKFSQLLELPNTEVNDVFRFRHSDGHWLWIECVAKNLLAEPDIQAIVVNYHDFTARKVLEEALHEQEHRASVLMGNLPGMAYRCLNDHDWTVQFASSGTLDLTGYTAAQFTSGEIKYNDIIHPDDRERIWNEVQKAVNQQQQFQFEYRIRTAGGEGKWVWEQGSGLFNDKGELQVLEGFITDITPRVQAREKQRLLASIIGQTDDAVLVTDPEGIIEYVNPAFEQITGYSSDEAIGNKPSLINSGLHDTSFFEDLWETIRGGESFHEVFTNRRKDGRIFYEQKTITPLTDEQGMITHYVSTAKDITETRQIEERLKLLTFALNHAHEAAYVIDGNACFIDVNDEACRALGYSRDELRGMNVLDIDPEITANQLKKNIDEIRKGSSLTIETRHRRKDGTTFPVEVCASKFDYDGKNFHLALVRDITERKQDESALRESELRFKNVVKATSDAIWDWDKETGKLWWDKGFKNLFDIDTNVTEPTYEGWYSMVHPDDVERVTSSLEQFVTSHDEHWKEEYRFLRKDGTYAYILDRAYAIRNNQGQLVRMVGGMTDLSEHKAAQDRILRLNRVYKMLSAVNTLIVHCHDRQKLLEEACRIAVNDGGLHMAWIGMLMPENKMVVPQAWAGHVDGFFQHIHVSIEDTGPGKNSASSRALREMQPMVYNFLAENEVDIPWKQEALDRGYYAVVGLPLIIDKKAVGVMTLYASSTDFFDKEEMELLNEFSSDISYALQNIVQAEKLNYLASYDPLTGLANRTLFNDHLNSVLERAKQNKKQVALLVCNLKQFRHINSVYGRETGDLVLQETARRLRSLTDDPVNIARIGADHFTLILHDVGDSIGIGHLFEHTLFPALNQPLVINDHDIQLNISGGIAVFPVDGTNSEHLFRNADAALNKAKLSNESYLFYQLDMTARIAETIQMENKLKTALKQEQFVLYYQPKIDSSKREITGLEALIRWQDPETGLVPPMKFIPILEETGLILEVGLWAIDRAASDYRQWLKLLGKVPRIAVNVSAIQLKQKNFVTDLEKAIRKSGKATPLDIELTESLIMSDIEQNINKLKAIKMAGLGIAIDDFGTGYSSLSYIARLPIDALKIDRSFINNMTTQADSMSIVSTIITLAHALKLKVIAEGVETEEQAKFLTLLKCDEMQGYLFSKPLPPKEIAELLSSGKTF